LRYEIPELRLKFISLFDLSDEIAASYKQDASDFHANEAETSLMLHLAEDLVSVEDAVDEADRTEGLVLQYPMPAVSSSGVVGTPSLASAERGRRLFEKLVFALTDLLVRIRAEKDPVL